jgi:hypothetical protein
VANKEENRELDVQRMRTRGIPVWVTDIETVPAAVASMRRLFLEVLEVGEDPAWLGAAEAAWCGPVSPPTARVVVPVWRDPWMVVGRPTFTADLLGRAGFEVSTAGVPGRYPAVDLAALDDPAAAELVLLPDEPYVFTSGDGPEAFRHLPTRLVSGRLLTWYGPALVDAAISLDRS